ncbi:hypothetical protein RRG08_008100 [Elysia crispata]|uniref:Uncharacterized protein n=1 Tax=Elysia crispata TaxID=231223 RepID=A0AAE0YB01_9GAST|nr:hypothetical protein RRG08_008100 [Elysia crispata]
MFVVSSIHSWCSYLCQRPTMDYIKLASAGVVTLGAATAYYLLQGPDAPVFPVDLDQQTKILPHRESSLFRDPLMFRVTDASCERAGPRSTTRAWHLKNRVSLPGESDTERAKIDLARAFYIAGETKRMNGRRLERTRQCPYMAAQKVEFMQSKSRCSQSQSRRSCYRPIQTLHCSGTTRKLDGVAPAGGRSRPCRVA